MVYSEEIIEYCHQIDTAIDDIGKKLYDDNEVIKLVNDKIKKNTKLAKKGTVFNRATLNNWRDKWGWRDEVKQANIDAAKKQRDRQTRKDIKSKETAATTINQRMDEIDRIEKRLVKSLDVGMYCREVLLSKQPDPSGQYTQEELEKYALSWEQFLKYITIMNNRQGHFDKHRLELKDEDEQNQRNRQTPEYFEEVKRLIKEEEKQKKLKLVK